MFVVDIIASLRCLDYAKCVSILKGSRHAFLGDTSAKCFSKDHHNIHIVIFEYKHCIVAIIQNLNTRYFGFLKGIFVIADFESIIYSAHYMS